MTLQQYLDEKKQIEKVIPLVEQYSEQDQSVSILPLDIKEELGKVKTLPPLTSSGLEKIDNILNDLYIGKVAVEQLIEKEQQPSRLPSTTQPVPIQKTAPSSVPQPKAQIESTWQSLTNIKPSQPTSTNNQGPQPKSKFNQFTK